MQVIQARNVNDAYIKGLTLLREGGVERPSRAGLVLVSPVPVTTVYSNPLERVLFEPQRDANPFFFLGEALWMLAGRNDARWLDRFVGDFSSRFAEEDGIQHGAYGYRWRHHFDMEGGGCPGLPDQLDTVVRLLQEDPNDRRVVLTMWDPVADLGADKRDVPCNLALTPRVVDGRLDITVFCRSNDAVWGAYGANAVHFSILQEYLAARVGVGVGKYYQISNNFHTYTEVLNKVWPAGAVLWDDDQYPLGRTTAYPLVVDPPSFDAELRELLEGYNRGGRYRGFNNSFLNEVAAPMLVANQCWRANNYEKACQWLAGIPEKNDWRRAAQAWIDRRQARRMSKDAEGSGHGCE